MRARVAVPTVAALVAALLAGSPPAGADHGTRPHTRNLAAVGHSPHPGPFTEPAPLPRVNSDLAFWGRLAYHGNYDGFRILDITNPRDPVELSYQRCNGDQGDIVVWENLLVRSWNTPAAVERSCDGQPVPAGFEGVHVFDVSNPADPVLVAAVELECGSHTVTLGGIVDGDLVVYSNNSSSGGCVDGTRANDDPAGDFMDVIGVPLTAPSNARLLRREPLAGPVTNVRPGCHDAAVILGSVNKAACASADAINVWDIGANASPGGSIVDPELLLTVSEPGVGQAGTNGRWHSVAFTWDGRVLVAGWEPGGGSEPECEASDPPVDKSLFFYDASTGAKLGQWVLPRAQGADENCTMHNYNVVPLRGRYVVVGGHYMAGTWATDFTNPAAPATLAWSDPPPLGPGQGGGAWSSYWYNHFVYESEIPKGLNVFELTTVETAPAVLLDHLNPQTQEFALTVRGRGRSRE